MRSLILGIFLCTSFITYGQELECEKFKNGKFQIIDSVAGNSIIERKGSKQIEYGEDSKLKLEFRVKWVNECSYSLELKKVHENTENIPLPEGMILTIEILETKDNSYVQKTSSNLYDMVLKTEVFKIDSQ